MAFLKAKNSSNAKVAPGKQNPVSKPQQGVTYTLKTAAKPRSSGKGLKRVGTAVGIFALNIAFLGGFLSLYSSLNPGDENVNLSTISEFNLQGGFGNISIPILDRGSLGLFSTDEDFPEFVASEPSVEVEFQNLVVQNNLFQQEGQQTKGLPKLEDQNWNIIGSGRLNTDTNNDLMLFNPQVNSVMTWFLDNGKLQGIKSFPTIKNPEWDLVSVADYNSDGQADMMWRQDKADGSDNFLLWTMLDGKVSKQQYVEVQLENLGDWELVGSADFDGNKTNDLVFRYKGENIDYIGANLIHYYEFKNDNLQPRERNQIQWLPWLNNPSRNDQQIQELVDIIDFNYDGFPDIIWRKNNLADEEIERGEMLVWIMNDQERLTIMRIPNTKDVNWKPHFVDLDNNQSYDIVWRNNGISEIPGCSNATTLWYLDKVIRLQTKLVEEVENCRG